MNPIAELQDEIQSLFPKAKITIDEAENEKQASWLDVTIARRRFTIESRPGVGFGISETSQGVDVGYGEGPAHVATTIDESLEQLLGLVAAEASA